MSFVHLGSIRGFPKIGVPYFGGPQNDDYGTLGFTLVSRLFWETTIQRSALRNRHRLFFFSCEARVLRRLRHSREDREQLVGKFRVWSSGF